ncbi:MAG: Glutamate 5-kinase [Syntrophorhabdaceae bacterium PtaU1.Bin034]|jgi:glutamate 5-kinase|nr:MAG: Glutamate 5-kinase [Syntrophorhabdaceae bacterium PtaU1.Bin034]
MGDVRRVVLKIGTSVLLDDEKKISAAKFADFARQIRAVKDQGVDVIMVSSGAVACGMETVGLKRKPKEMAKKQALASIGQIVLMRLYMDAFARVGLTASQILLTHEDTKSRSRCINLMNTIDTLLAMDMVPVINENDTLSFKEIMFGDNDNLSALIAQITNADLLVLLSDVEGLYEKDPNRHPDARMIKLVKKIDEDIEALAQGTNSEKSVGGMTSKLEAAKKAGKYGIPTRLVKGDVKDVVSRVLTGEEIGTLFTARKRLTRKKCWIAFAFKSRGKLWIDQGAQKALLDRGKSLLPSGIVNVEGAFSRGECVEVTDADNKLIARGIVNYSSSDIERIKGSKSIEIERKLGYKYTEEVIHRDNMVIL